jgi:hypothetical protein
MTITELRCRSLTGTLESDGPFWEERLGRPIDVYPEYRMLGPEWLEPIDHRHYRTHSTFVEIDTDAGITGVWGPLDIELGRQILRSSARTRARPNCCGIRCTGRPYTDARAP